MITDRIRERALSRWHSQVGSFVLASMLAVGPAASMAAVAEGYPTARSAYRLARQHGVSTPVIDEVYAMLYEGKHVGQAVRDLMSRDLKPEL